MFSNIQRKFQTLFNQPSEEEFKQAFEQNERLVKEEEQKIEIEEEYEEIIIGDIVDTEEVKEKLKSLIKKMKSYRDKKIFDHVNIPISIIPVVGPITNIIHGSKRKDKKEIIVGSAFLALDVVTLGATSLLVTNAKLAEKAAVSAAMHTSDIARGIRNGTKGMMGLRDAAMLRNSYIATTSTLSMATKISGLTEVGIKAANGISTGSLTIKLSKRNLNKEEREIIVLIHNCEKFIGEELIEMMNDKIIKYLNNPICSPKLNKIIKRLELVKNNL